MARLGVNIDHVATLRQARREFEPDPIQAALISVKSGAHSIVAHLREDRRHINDSDIVRLRKVIKRLNLEMSINPGIVDIACRVKPDQVTLVPERRQEITTEGGLDVKRFKPALKKACERLSKRKIEISLFIDADKSQIDATHDLGIKIIELHTGTYAKAFALGNAKKEFIKLSQMSAYAQSLGMTVNAGHGLNYENTALIASIKGMHELNIGHSIISRAVFTGLASAVREMRTICHSRTLLSGIQNKN